MASSKVQKIAGKGIRVHLVDYPLLRFGDGSQHFANEDQAVFREGLLEQFLAHADNKVSFVDFDLTLDSRGKELVSISDSIERRKIPASNLEEFENAFHKLYEQANSPSLPPKSRKIISEFKLPDPDRQPEFFRVSGKGKNSRFVVLWGCEKIKGSSIPPLEAIEKLRKFCQTNDFSLVRMFLKFLAVAVTLLAILYAANFFLQVPGCNVQWPFGNFVQNGNGISLSPTRFSIRDGTDTSAGFELGALKRSDGMALINPKVLNDLDGAKFSMRGNTLIVSDGVVSKTRKSEYNVKVLCVGKTSPSLITVDVVDEQNGKPVDGQESKPVVGQESKPVVGQESKPVVGQESKPVIGQESKPVVGQEGKPVVGQEGKPVVGQEGKPVVGQEGKPVVGQEGKPKKPELVPAWFSVKEGTDTSGGFELGALKRSDGVPLVNPRLLKDSDDDGSKFSIRGQSLIVTDGTVTWKRQGVYKAKISSDGQSEPTEVTLVVDPFRSKEYQKFDGETRVGKSDGFENVIKTTRPEAKPPLIKIVLDEKYRGKAEDGSVQLRFTAEITDKGKLSNFEWLLESPQSPTRTLATDTNELTDVFHAGLTKIVVQAEFLGPVSNQAIPVFASAIVENSRETTSAWKTKISTIKGTK